MQPVVMAMQDTNNNGAIDVKDMPTVLFMSYVSGGSYAEEGFIRALRGDTGKELFTITSHAVNALGSLAVGDIDNDGKPDIIAPRYAGKSVSNSGIYAFSNTGTLKWVAKDKQGKIAPLPISWGGAAIADLNGDGNPEVIVGDAIIRGSDGLVLCQGGQGNGSDDQRRPLSAIADLNGDGKQEVVTGRAAYQHDCSVLWNNGAKDGYVAIADFNADGKPEVAVVSSGTLRVQNGQTGKVLMSVAIPGGGSGPPTIADFNGDKKPDIAAAGSNYYVIYSPDFTTNKLSLLWQYKTQDFSSGRTGSSVFDFEGDNKAEAVYNDERFMRVFDGATGKVLFSQANTSATTIEYPIVVDVNNDDRAELIFCSNNGTMAHLRVFRDKLDNWVNTRNVWNQHAYNVTNICTGDRFCPPGSTFGQVPAKPLDNWKTAGLNNFRQNAQGKGVFDAADLLPKGLKGRWKPCTLTLTAGVWVVNQGTKRIPSKIPVSWFQESGGKRTLLQTTATPSTIEPGEAVYLETTLTFQSAANYSLYVAIDDDGKGQSTRNECNEKNNTATLDLPPTEARKPSTEVCDNKDNDCNGQIDENLRRPCNTDCGKGEQVCTQGDWSDCSAPQPKPETCDGRDNNCDGQIDNGATCPGSAVCVDGQCRSKCRNGECFQGQQCKSGICYDLPCEPTCESGKVCVRTQCVDRCSVITCPDGEVCQSGQCKPIPSNDGPPQEPGSNPDGSTTE